MARQPASRSSSKFKRIKAEKSAKMPPPAGRSIQPGQLVQKPKKKKETKREKRRKLREQSEFPGIQEIADEVAESLVAGEGILAFTFDANKRISEEKGKLEENGGPEGNPEAGKEHSNKQENEQNGEQSDARNNEQKEGAMEEAGSIESQEDLTESSESDSSDGFISVDIDEPDTELGRQFTEHEADEDHRVSPWMGPDVTCKTLAEQLSREMLEFLSYMSPNAQEKRQRVACVSRLRNVVQFLWATASLEVFGSYATGMYLPDADIDVVIFDNQSMGHKLRSEMYKLGHRLKMRGVTDNVQVIAHARVPIVKYVDNASGLSVDIAFGQTSGVEVVGRVCTWLRENPTLKPLAMIVRQFLKRRSLSDVANGGLGGYATICMAYSRLMQWKLHLRPNELNSESLLDNIGLLLLDFFDYYGNNFDNQALVVRVNSNFKPYQKRMNGNMVTNKTQGIAIEDPNDYGNNISKGTYNYVTIKRSFSNAASYLKGLCRRWDSMDEQKRTKLSFLAPLLRFNGSEAQRTKIGVKLALSTPDMPNYSAVLEPPKMEPKIENGRKDIANSIRELMTARPPRQRGPKRRSDSREPRQQQPQQTHSQARTQTSKQAQARTQAPSSPPQKQQKIDPWSGKPVEPEGSKQPEETKAPNQSDPRPSKESKESKDPKESSKPELKRRNSDEDDSRTKLTSSERRSFWKRKAGTPEPNEA